MPQKIEISFIKRLVECISTCRFIILKILGSQHKLYLGYPQQGNKATRRYDNPQQKLLPFILILSLFSCGEPEIRLSRADLRMVDTLVNQQLDSISPMLDSLCIVRKDTLIQYWADSIMKERKKQEERLRLNISNNQ